MSFRRKTYPEVSDHLLNRLLGGVSGEPHAYPPPGSGREPFTHALEKSPAAEVTSVYGMVNGGSFLFAKGVDYELASDGAKVAWKPNGQRPDAGSVVEINYLPKQRETRANDLYAGSIVRTLLEAVALETAGLYAQMETVYRSGFIDTAEGGALDHVVSVLGLQRVKAGRNVAELELTRAKNSRGEILVPAGTRVLTADGGIEYETTADVTLADGQPTAKVSARDLVETNDSVPAASLTLLAKSIAGIEAVTNRAPSTRLDRDETDEELRTRAKSFLTGSERGTLGAIQAAIAREGILADVDDTQPGLIAILFHDDQLPPEQRKRLEDAVRAVKPAGVAVQFTYGESPVPVELEIRLTTAPGLLDADLKRIQQDIRGRVTDYFAKLPTKSVGSITKLIGLTMGVDGVEDVAVVSATAGGNDVLDAAKGELKIKDIPTQLGTLTIVDPALATLLTVLVRYPKDAKIPDQGAIQSALQAAVSYLNELNAAPGAPEQKRTLSWGKLALATPLPDFTAVALADFDANPGAFTLPTAAQRDPYNLQLVFTRPTGVSQMVDTESAPALLLAPFERLSLAKATAEVKPKGGGA
jgi:Baseplate J-like protein